MQIFLAASPAETQAASKHCRSLAHAAYRIGESSSLLRQNLLLQTRGGLLCVSDRNAPVIEDPTALCQAVLRECGRRSYQGVLLDFEDHPRQDRVTFVQQLEKTLSTNRRTLYLPESYMDAAPTSVGLICTAMSGGHFEQRLQEAVGHRGNARRLALDVQRLQMDFRLPARSGMGEPLNRETFQQLLQKEQPSIFFSPDLCARYFTYSRNGETHFVLFDDADTLRQKVRHGTALGFSAAFFMWPEIKDIASDLFR